MITITAQITISGETIDFNRRNITSIGSSIFDRSDIKRPSYGIISNTGELEFNDYDGKFLDYAEKGLLTSDLPIVIFLNNTLSKAKQQIATFETREWNYDANNKSVSVTLKDDLEEWQDIQIDGFEYDVRNPNKVLSNKTMADLYKWLYNKTPTKYSMKSFDLLDANTKQILNTTIIPFPQLKSATLWTQWTKICVVCGLYIYKNSLGDTTCSYNYGA